MTKEKESSELNYAKHFSCESNPILELILKKWTDIQFSTVNKPGWETDALWWYNERASLSSFAGAVWQSGGLVLEEYANIKVVKTESNTEEIKNGRTDIYFELDKFSWIGEAKQIFNTVDKLKDENIINDTIKKAENQIKDYQNYYENTKRMVLIFIGIKSKTVEVNKIKELQDKLQNKLQNKLSKNYTGIAWAFPKMGQIPYNDGYYFPGTILIIKELAE